MQRERSRIRQKAHRACARARARTGSAFLRVRDTRPIPVDGVAIGDRQLRRRCYRGDRLSGPICRRPRSAIRAPRTAHRARENVTNREITYPRVSRSNYSRRTRSQLLALAQSNRGGESRGTSEVPRLGCASPILDLATPTAL